MLRVCFCLGILLLVSACAAPPSSGPVKVAPSATEATGPEGLEQLPGLEVQRDPLILRYPEQRLYVPGAALPSQEGLAALQALAKWLSTNPEQGWTLRLWNRDGETAENRLALAAKRQELLQRFFRRQGVETDDWSWESLAGSGADLELEAVRPENERL